MASSSQGLRIGIQIILGIVIVALAYWLYLSITEPYEAIERREELTQLTRDRMDDVRKALVRYEAVHDRFPGTLDSLVLFVRQDSILTLRPDSIFGAGFNPDSLIVSPRTGKRFDYSAVDTTRVPVYLLEDPDSDDQIGTLSSDVTKLNAASWE